jgi:hypothetical protein
MSKDNHGCDVRRLLRSLLQAGGGVGARAIQSEGNAYLVYRLTGVATVNLYEPSGGTWM